jgi:hypothetical protein
MQVGEQRACPTTRRFLRPCSEGVSRVRGERRAPFLSPFADASDMRADAEMDGIPVEAG